MNAALLAQGNKQHRGEREEEGQRRVEMHSIAQPQGSLNTGRRLTMPSGWGRKSRFRIPPK